MLLSVLCGGSEGAVTFVRSRGENEVACVHAIQPDSNINLPVFPGLPFLSFLFEFFECMSVRMSARVTIRTARECVLGMRVSLLDRCARVCVSRTQFGGGGINPCPCPCR